MKGDLNIQFEHDMKDCDLDFSMEDCVNVLKEVDKEVIINNVVSFECKIVEE